MVLPGDTQGGTPTAQPAPEAKQPIWRAVEPPPPPQSVQEQVDSLTVETLRFALGEARKSAEDSERRAKFWEGIATQLRDEVIKGLQSNLGVAYAQHRDLLQAVTNLLQALKEQEQEQEPQRGPDLEQQLMAALMKIKQKQAAQGQPPQGGQGGR
jgi:hypothetical protein